MPGLSHRGGRQHAFNRRADAEDCELPAMPSSPKGSADGLLRMPHVSRAPRRTQGTSMAKQVMPQAELQPRAGEIALPEPLFPRISLFAQMKSPPSLDKFPGTVALRRFRKGEVICQHGEAGWTAFYLLTRTDLVELRDYPRRRLQDVPQEKAKNKELLAAKR